MQLKIEKRYIATIISIILLLAFAGYVIATAGVSHSWNELTDIPAGFGEMKVAYGTANNGATVNLATGTISSGTYNGDSGFTNIKGVIVSNRDVQHALNCFLSVFICFG